jgi:hypothetical protein
MSTLYCLEELRGEQRISPPGVTSPPGDKINRWGTTLPLGSNFILPLGAKLRMGLRHLKDLMIPAST